MIAAYLDLSDGFWIAGTDIWDLLHEVTNP